jgi:hypothetical protein
MRDVLELYDALDLMVRSGDRIAAHEQLIMFRNSFAEVRQRSATLGSTLLVALAGGTGTGKSSLLNAIAGETVATVSRLRPHTERALAWIPEDAGSEIERVLVDLGVDQIRRQAALPGIALIDLPDMDSIAPEHTAEVVRHLAAVDAIVWVLDPEKYHDFGLCKEFLAPMSAYADQAAFVLNKIDQIAEGDRPDLLASVKRTLAAAGYPEAVVFPLAADPAVGPPSAVEPLVGFLAKRIDRKQVAYGKLLTDVAYAIRELGVGAGVWSGAELGLEERWRATRDAALSTLQPDNGLPNEDALCRIEDLVAAVAGEVGGELGADLRKHLGEEEVTRVMTMAQQAVSELDFATAQRLLDEQIGAAMADVVIRKSRFAALVALTHVGVRQIAHRYGVTLR